MKQLSKLTKKYVFKPTNFNFLFTKSTKTWNLAHSPFSLTFYPFANLIQKPRQSFTFKIFRAFDIRNRDPVPGLKIRYANLFCKWFPWRYGTPSVWHRSKGKIRVGRPQFQAIKMLLQNTPVPNRFNLQ